MSYRGIAERVSSAAKPCWLHQTRIAAPSIGSPLEQAAAKAVRVCARKKEGRICIWPQKERAGFASGPEALGNGGVSSREDAAYWHYKVKIWLTHRLVVDLRANEL